jgi:ribosome modulation factor
MNPFMQGYEARLRGEPPEANPYMRTSTCWFTWLRGYESAFVANTNTRGTSRE